MCIFLNKIIVASRGSWYQMHIVNGIFHIGLDVMSSGPSLQWRHNDHDGVPNHQPHGCLLNRLFGRRTKKTSKLCVTGLCAGNSPGPVNSPHKGPVTRKMFTFDDVITLPYASSFSYTVCQYYENAAFHKYVRWTGQPDSWINKFTEHLQMRMPSSFFVRYES